MEYIGIDEAAKKWGVSKRFVQVLCANGRIDGAARLGRAWMIPKNAKKPIDGRTKAAKAEYDADMPLPRKTPFLYMTDLYHTPATADTVGESLSYNHEAQVLFEAEVAYSRGEIDKVYDIANYLLNKHSGFYAVLSAGMLLAMCAIWKGDIHMWRKAKICFTTREFAPLITEFCSKEYYKYSVEFYIGYCPDDVYTMDFTGYNLQKAQDGNIPSRLYRDSFYSSDEETKVLKSIYNKIASKIRRSSVYVADRYHLLHFNEV